MANTSTFLWSATVSGIGMCLSLGITLIRLVPNIYDKALEKYPTGILVEVIQQRAISYIEKYFL